MRNREKEGEQIKNLLLWNICTVLSIMLKEKRNNTVVKLRSDVLGCPMCHR